MVLLDTSELKPRRIPPNTRLEPKQSALVIVDMMNRFCDPGWLSGRDREKSDWLQRELEGVIGGIKRALDAFRRADGLVVHVVNAKWTADGREAVPYERGRDLRPVRYRADVHHRRLGASQRGGDGEKGGRLGIHRHGTGFPT